MRTTKTVTREVVQRIMYVCEWCEENAPESCGHYDRNELAVTDDDQWLCEGCWDEWKPEDGGYKPAFSAARKPPWYRPSKTVR